MNIYNSLTKKTEDFKPLNPQQVGMYTCGFTVYDFAHLGSGRKYVNDDILRRTLEFLGYSVNHVQNVTDVGHLVSDADEGEDKMEKGAKRSGKTVWEVAEFFTNHFYSSMDKLNILRPHVICKATEHIPEQIELVKKLLEKGYAYDTEEAVYFDVSKFKTYGQLFGQNLEDKQQAVRAEVQKGEHKKSPQDFALWFKRVGRFKDHTMYWESSWGEGFPGWHIECSAMSMKYLGEQFDIHTGGEDHLPVHHPNEIAQSEAATGKNPFVKYWVHYAFLVVDGKKMSKSLGNFYTIEDVVEKGFDPIALRYLYLTTHYKKQINFTWDALSAASSALEKLREYVQATKAQTQRTSLSPEKQQKIKDLKNAFKDALENDLNMPQALAVVWETVKSNIPSEDKYDLLVNFDEVLGFGLSTVTTKAIPQEITVLAKKRDDYRASGDYSKADEMRKRIESKGFSVQDTPNGTVVK